LRVHRVARTEHSPWRWAASGQGLSECGAAFLLAGHLAAGLRSRLKAEGRRVMLSVRVVACQVERESDGAQWRRRHDSRMRAEGWAR
jgi:hypothetical protein